MWCCHPSNEGWPLVQLSEDSQDTLRDGSADGVEAGGVLQGEAMNGDQLQHALALLNAAGYKVMPLERSAEPKQQPDGAALFRQAKPSWLYSSH